MNVLGDLLDPTDDRTALDRPAFSAGETSMAQFTRTAWKTGNYFRHLGVRHGSTVAVADDPVPEVLYALFGAGLLGATIRVGLPQDDWRVAVVPTAAVDQWSTPPGSTRIAYGSRPADPSVAHFGTQVWSENPTFPDDGTVDETDPLIVTDSRSMTHEAVLEAAATVVERNELDDADVVALRSSLRLPGTIVAGVVAPIVAGATILFPDGDATGTVAVAVDGDEPPESSVIDPTGVPTHK